MTQNIRITVLVENTVRTRGLRAEHGLSIHLQAGKQNLLFDAGQSLLLLDNARQLGIDLASLDAVILSHGHYDHTGGLEAVLNLSPNARVYCHPAALAPKFAREKDGSSRAIGITPPNLEALRTREKRRVATSGVTEVAEGLFVTGEIPRRTPYEDVGGPFFLDDACRKPDPIQDDQSLFFDTPDGVAVVLGCAHAGVVNTLNHIREQTGGRPFWTVLGGMHLVEAGKDRMTRTLEALRELNPRTLRPMHCTGAKAAAELWGHFPGRCLDGPAGTILTFSGRR